MAVKSKKIPESPMKDVGMFPEENRLPRYLTQEELNRLYQSCSDHVLSIVKLACNTDLRKGKLLNLRWKDIDFENRILYIIKTKSGKPMKAELNHTAIDTLNKIKRHPKSEYVFCDSEGNKYFTVRKSFNNALKKAGLENEGIVFHSLRHTFAAHLLMKGVGLVTVKELLGHANIETTMIYSHLSKEHKRMAVEVLDTIIGDTTANKQLLTERPVETAKETLS